MSGKQTALSEQLRQAISRSGLTVYRIAKDCGIAESQLHNFMKGECGLGIDRIDRLGQYLDLVLRPRKPGTRSKGA